MPELNQSLVYTKARDTLKQESPSTTFIAHTNEIYQENFIFRRAFVYQNINRPDIKSKQRKRTQTKK